MCARAFAKGRARVTSRVLCQVITCIHRVGPGMELALDPKVQLHDVRAFERYEKIGTTALSDSQKQGRNKTQEF